MSNKCHKQNKAKKPLEMQIGATSVDHLYKFENDVSNETLFESWKPKIKAYQEALDKAQPVELRAPVSDVPENLDTAIFNTVDYILNSKVISDDEKTITELTATELASKIQKKELTSVKVLTAFVHRAVVLNQFTNFAMEFFIGEAIARAKELDEYIESHGEPVGPLHGIPISLKEQIGMAGKITNGGWVGWLDNIPTEDATTIKTLRKLGAIFYVRTNQPQSLMHLDSNNNIIGRTRNPYNSLLTSGGSSGGEGCCVAGKGSPLGVGTDIGGSIRAPAAFAGCYGLRPTSRRISTFGGVSSGKGQESVVAVAGPLSNSIDDIDLFMKAYINEGKPWDDDQWCLPIHWREVSKPDPKDITVAIMSDDGLVKPHPPIARGLKFVSKKLADAGVKVVEFKPIETAEAYEVVNTLFSCDGNFAQKDMIKPSGEPLLPLTKWALSFGKGDEKLSITENRELNYRRDALRKKYNDFFVKEKVDFIISPTYVGVAPVCIEDGKAGPFYWGYTALFNILDLPTLTSQTGLKQDPNLDPKDDSYKPRSEIEKIEHDKYIPELFEGAPIAFQLSGRRYFDEEVVAFGKVVDDILKA